MKLIGALVLALTLLIPGSADAATVTGSQHDPHGDISPASPPNAIEGDSATSNDVESFGVAYDDRGTVQVAIKFWDRHERDSLYRAYATLGVSEPDGSCSAASDDAVRLTLIAEDTPFSPEAIVDVVGAPEPVLLPHAGTSDADRVWHWTIESSALAGRTPDCVTQVSYTTSHDANDTVADFCLAADGGPDCGALVPFETATIEPPFGPDEAAWPTLTGASTTVTIPAVEDSYVRSDSPRSNFGDATTLWVDASPVQIAYFKFDLRAYAGRQLRSATLQVHTGSTPGARTTGPQNVRLVVDDGWSEDHITHNSRPALSTTLASFIPRAISTDYTIALPSTSIAGEVGSTLSLAIDSSTLDDSKLTSRESSTAPRLVLAFREDGPAAVTGPADMLDMNLQSGDWPAVGASVTTGKMGPYQTAHHGNHIYVRNDPKGVRLNGAPRKVLEFQTHDSDTGPTSNPRTQLDAPLMIKEGQEIYWGFAYLLPPGSPKEVRRGSVNGNAFHTMGSLGSPNGSSRSRTSSAGAYGGTWRFGLRFEGNGDWVWSMPQVVDKWIDVVFRIKYRKDDTGFVEVYTNEGAGWHIRTLDSSIGGGTRWNGQTAFDDEPFPKRPRIANYFLKDQYKRLGRDPISIFYTEHKIATTLERAKPHSYG